MADAFEASLAAHGDLVFECLDAAAPSSVIEVGSFEGEFTAPLLDWAASRGGVGVAAVEPQPSPELLELRRRHPELELVEEPSHDALRRLPPADAVIIDGDHNYFTVSEELRLISERAAGTGMPLIIFHDVCWPHARRDTYYEPDRIPDGHRQELAEEARLAPGQPGTSDVGILFKWAAAREGGSRNGVLTAIEDFMAGHEGLHLAVVPVFFGLGVMWPDDAPWAPSVAATVAPWDRNPVLERLEDERVKRMVDRVRLNRQSELLRAMLASRAFALAELVSRWRQRGAPVFSRERIRRVLGD